ncbi:hypothetical protein EC991_010242 [Linnemannia zychae]|nr:hypothetical protein EC991_010242 [Linnemannia zychae]
MKFELSDKYTWNMRLALMVLTSSNSLFLVASIGFKDTDMADSRFLIIPQININIITLFYAYFKTRLLSHANGQLVLSSIFAGVYLFFCVKVFPIIDESTSLLRVVESINLIVVVLLLAEAVCTFFIDKDNKAEQDEIFAANRRSREERRQQQRTGRTDAGDTVAIPTAVHLYQPRLDLLSPTSSSIDGNVINQSSVISSSTSGNNAEEVRLDITDNYELEVLPKYQRKPPAQSATIIDMANLASVDPAVLNTVVRPLSSSSSSSEMQALDVMHGAQQPSTALEQQEQRQEQEQEQASQQDDIPSSDAPEYSPQPPSSSSLSLSSPLPTATPIVPSLTLRAPTQPPTYVP